MAIQTLAVIGLGVLGGSVGLAVRRHAPAARVVGVDASAATLSRAIELGAIAEKAASLEEAARQADMLIVCTPVEVIAEQVRRAAAVCRPGTLLTDVGSTKLRIVQDVERGGLPEGVHFVGSHPLAGSAKQGPEAARADLFEGRVVVVTPGQAPAEAVARVTAFWAALHARVHLLPPEEHDRILAYTSHLPHLLASALAGALPPEWRPFAATGFRDTTRIAAGGAALWRAILAANREPVLDALDLAERQLALFRQALAGHDDAALEELLRLGRESRLSLDP